MTYQLVTPPVGMQIDSNGLITWNPNLTQIGIKVSYDNSTTTQTYQLEVTDRQINRTPTILQGDRPSP